MTSELTKALVAFHQSVPTIHKTAKSYTNQYAPLDEVLSVVTPALSKQGLCITHTFEPQPESEQPLLICTLHHTSGETLESRLPLVVAKGKHPTQDLGSAITYLKRYTLLAILGLTADVDTDGNLDQPPSETKTQPSPKPQPKAAKKQAEPTPEPEPAPPSKDTPVSPEERDELLRQVIRLPIEQRNAIVAAFRKEFKLPDDAKLKTHLTTDVHATFLLGQFNSELS